MEFYWLNYCIRQANWLAWTLCRKLIRHGIAYVKMHIENEDLLCRASSLVPPSSLAAASISAQDANMCSPCLTDKGRVIAGFTKTSRDGVFYQPKGRCYIDPRIVTALSLSSSLAPHQSPPCRAHCVGHTTWYTLILPSRAVWRYSENLKYSI